MTKIGQRPVTPHDWKVLESLPADVEARIGKTEPPLKWLWMCARCGSIGYAMPKGRVKTRPRGPFWLVPAGTETHKKRTPKRLLADCDEAVVNTTLHT